MPFFAAILALAAPGAAAPPAAEAEQPGEAMVPATNPGSWVTNDDYPAAAMRDEREGTTGFRLTISADGLPEQCDVTAPSGHPDLDAATCRLLMERARFKAGRDARGMRVGGTYSNRIRWQIPDGYQSQLASAGFSVDEGRGSWPRGPLPLPAMQGIDLEPHYPAAARAAGHEGDVHMDVSVDALGKVTGCTVAEGSMSPDLDKAACAVMRSDGAFEPALDSVGKPTSGVVAAVFRWVLPRADGAGGEAPRALRKFPFTEEGWASLSVLVDAEGRASGCTYSKSGGTWLIAPGIDPCDAIGGALRYIPFKDAAGNPVAKRVTVRIEAKADTPDAAKSGAAP